MDNPSDLAKVLAGWRDDPAAFVREALRAEPEAWQEEALENYTRHDRLTIRSGHGVGKSTLLAWVALHFLITHYPCKVPVTGPTAHQLFDVLWAEIALWMRRLPDFLRSQYNLKSDRLELAGAPLEAFAAARTSRREQPDALQGFHSEHLLFLCDEASGIDDIVFEVAAGAMSTKGSKLILTGNPTRTLGYFYRSHQSGSGFKRMHVPCSRSTRVSQDYLDYMAKAFGEGSNIYRVRVLGEFPVAADDTLISLELAESASVRDLVVYPMDPVWGLDVARFGDDSSCLVKRFSRGMVENPLVWQGLDTMQLTGAVANEYQKTPEKERPDHIYVDVIGIGAGVVDRLFELGLPVVPVNVSERPSFAVDTVNRLRDELWFNASKWLEGRDVKIMPHERLIGELTTPRKLFSSSGKLRVESKDELRSRGVRSPDVADAFCLTFAYQNFNFAGFSSPGRGKSDWSKPISRQSEGTFI